MTAAEESYEAQQELFNSELQAQIGGMEGFFEIALFVSSIELIASMALLEGDSKVPGKKLTDKKIKEYLNERQTIKKGTIGSYNPFFYTQDIGTMITKVYNMGDKSGLGFKKILRFFGKSLPIITLCVVTFLSAIVETAFRGVAKTLSVTTSYMFVQWGTSFTKRLERNQKFEDLILKRHEQKYFEEITKELCIKRMDALNFKDYKDFFEELLSKKEDFRLHSSKL